MPFQLRKYLDGIRIPFLEKNKNSVSKLFFDYKDIKNMIKDESNNFLKTLYFNKENAENILYESEELITINNDLLKRMKNLFYLDLLIMNTPYIINYTFSGEVILTLYKAINTIKETTNITTVFQIDELPLSLFSSPLFFSIFLDLS